MPDRTLRAGLGPALLLAVLLPALAPGRLGAQAVQYGDVALSVEPTPKGANSHGYTEYGFLVHNDSKERAHLVSLTLGGDEHGMYPDHVRAVSRTMEVGPEATVRFALSVPHHPPLAASGLVVGVDGRVQEQRVGVRLAPTHAASPAYGYRGMPYGTLAPSSYAAAVHDPLVLVSPSVPNTFDGLGRPGFPPPGGGMPGMMGGPPGGGMMGMAVPGSGGSAQFVRPDQPAALWGGSWLGYSRYDGVVVTADDLRAAPAVRGALWQYAEAGGTLLVLGRADLPGGWRRQPGPPGVVAHDAAFGRCFVAPLENVPHWQDERWAPLRASWGESARPWQRVRSVGEAHLMFPVVRDVGLPVRGLFVLMVLFAVAIGPVNLWLLSRSRRRIWLLWTVPCLSLATCLVVFGYMVVAEGWRGHVRTAAVTILDETSHRAATVGWTGFYSPLTPRAGLRFGPDTELSYQDAPAPGHSGAGSACFLDWTDGQRLPRGWVTARVPSYFLARKSEPRRERVALGREADGAWSMVNGLGAEVRAFWYADAAGRLYQAGPVAPGAKATLTPAGTLPDAASRRKLRELYTTEWVTNPSGLAAEGVPLPEALARDPGRVLAPRTYLAVLDESPFLEEGLPDARTRRACAAVLGLLKEKDDAN